VGFRMVVFSSEGFSLVVGILPYVGLRICFREDRLGYLECVVSNKWLSVRYFSSRSATVNHVVGYPSVGLCREVGFGVGGRGRGGMDLTAVGRSHFWGSAVKMNCVHAHWFRWSLALLILHLGGGGFIWQYGMGWGASCMCTKVYIGFGGCISLQGFDGNFIIRDIYWLSQ
jgi:hypothetical protein